MNTPVPEVVVAPVEQWQDPVGGTTPPAEWHEPPALADEPAEAQPAVQEPPAPVPVELKEPVTEPQTVPVPAAEPELPKPSEPESYPAIDSPRPAGESN
jgi:hypothetical protein